MTAKEIAKELRYQAELVLSQADWRAKNLLAIADELDPPTVPGQAGWANHHHRQQQEGAEGMSLATLKRIAELEQERAALTAERDELREKYKETYAAFEAMYELRTELEGKVDELKRKVEAVEAELVTGENGLFHFYDLGGELVGDYRKYGNAVFEMWRANFGITPEPSEPKEQ